MSSEFVRASNHQIKSFTQDKEGSWNDSFYFVFAADPQPGLVDKCEGGNGSTWQTEIKRSETAVAAINYLNPKPKFLMIGGDIVDAFPGTTHRNQQIADLKQAFSNLDPAIPLLAISGNHDVGNSPTNETMVEYRREFGDEFYSFWVGGVFFIAINSQCFFNSSETPEICSQQSAWLDIQLENAKTNKCQHVVVFMHIPLFVENPDEEDMYFNIPRENRFDLLQKFANARVEKVFSGHLHRNCGGVWTRTNLDGSSSKIEVVVSTAIGAQLGKDEPGVIIAKVTRNEIVHRFYPLTDIPRSIPF